MDFCRHAMKYQATDSGAIAQLNILNTYQGATTPQLVCYEAASRGWFPRSVETTTNPTGSYLRAALSADLFYDPGMHDWEFAFYEFCQHSGISLAVPFFLGGTFGGAAELARDRALVIHHLGQPAFWHRRRLDRRPRVAT